MMISLPLSLGGRLGRRVRLLIHAGAIAALATTTIGSVYLLAADGSPSGSAPMTTTADSSDQAATMSTVTKADAFREVLKKMGAGEKVDPQLWNTFVAAQNDGLQTGPKIGSKVPDFSLPDQNGKQLSLHELMGPKGLLLVFLRSADW